MSDEQIQKLVEWLYANAQQGNWRVLVAGSLSAVVWFLRVGILRPSVDRLPVVGRLSKWFKTDRGGVALTLSVGVLGGVATAIEASHVITPQLILSGVINGVIGAGVFNVFKRVISPSDQPKATKGVSIPITLLALVFLTSCAKGEFMFRYDQGTITSAMAAMSCKDTLSEAQKMKLTMCRDLLAQKKFDESQKCLDEWTNDYGVADVACKAIAAEAKGAAAARGLIAAAVDGEKRAQVWITRLIVAQAKLVEVFSRLGIPTANLGVK